ncbi:MAG: SH3 domain-containing protein [Parvibaculaceae bacterium]|nr:SH3 domain-containing protein [Parvibaculaceae bacterium]
MARRFRGYIFTGACLLPLVLGLAPASAYAADPAPAATPAPEANAAKPPKPPAKPTAATLMANGIGPVSGLPVPRYVSLKSNKINVRRGPGDDYPVVWTFTRKGMPVQVTGEYSLWRRIQDADGDSGWVYHSMLSGDRTATILPVPGSTDPRPIYASPDPQAKLVAVAEPGVVADIKGCEGQWCRIEASGYEGYIPRSQIWGVGPAENF